MRAVLGMAPDGSPELVLHDERGRSRARLEEVFSKVRYTNLEVAAIITEAAERRAKGASASDAGEAVYERVVGVLERELAEVGIRGDVGGRPGPGRPGARGEGGEGGPELFAAEEAGLPSPRPPAPSERLRQRPRAAPSEGEADEGDEGERIMYSAAPPPVLGQILAPPGPIPAEITRQQDIIQKIRERFRVAVREGRVKIGAAGQAAVRSREIRMRRRLSSDGGNGSAKSGKVRQNAGA